MKLLVIGYDGQLGYDFMQYSDDLDYEVIGLNEDDFDVSKREDVFSKLSKLDFDTIINTSAYHGYKAYKDNSPKKFYSVNTFGPYYLAEYARMNDRILVHFSTDYVFSGNMLQKSKSFTENDLPKPANLYASSKLAGENIIPLICNKYYIIRIASIYGHKGCKAKNNSNFVEMVIGKLENNEIMEVVDDIIMSPTSTKTIVEWTINIIEKSKFGLYHLAGSGSCSWYEFAKEICAYLNYPSDLIQKSSTKEVKQEIQRGKNTSLKNLKFIDSNISDLPNWKKNLYEYLDERSIR